MNRRALVTGLAAVLAAPLSVGAQPPEQIARIGMLRSEHRRLDDRIKQNIADVRTGLQDEGYAKANTIESITTLRRTRLILSSSRRAWWAKRST
jgi:hypothetical protein